MKTLKNIKSQNLNIAHKSNAFSTSATKLNIQLTTESTKSSIAQRDDEKILLPIKNEYLVVKTKDILFIQADGSYCVVHLSTGPQHLISSSLKNFISKYNLPFIRCHQSYLINPAFIEAITQDKTIRMKNDIIIPVARRKYKDVVAYFNG